MRQVGEEKLNIAADDFTYVAHQISCDTELLKFPEQQEIACSQ